MDRNSTLLAYYEGEPTQAWAPSSSTRLQQGLGTGRNGPREAPRRQNSPDPPRIVLSREDERYGRRTPSPVEGRGVPQPRFGPPQDSRGPRPRQAPPPTMNQRPVVQKIDPITMPPRAAFVAPPSNLSSPGSAAASPMSEKEHMLWDGPENDRMGAKDLDFWRRFSMVVHASEKQPAKKSRCVWRSALVICSN